MVQYTVYNGRKSHQLCQNFTLNLIVTTAAIWPEKYSVNEIVIGNTVTWADRTVKSEASALVTVENPH